MISKSIKVLFTIVLSLILILVLTSCDSSSTSNSSDLILVNNYEVNITVIDSHTEESIAGAEVSLGDKTAITDSNGLAKFNSVEEGQYSLSVTAEDYEMADEGVVTVDSNFTNFIINMEQIIIISVEYFTFDSSTGTIIDYDPEGGLDVVIPANIDDIKVVKIGDEAFMNKQLTSIKIPESVSEIGRKAFAFNQLSEIDITDRVEVGDFSFCENQLTKIIIGENVILGNNLLSSCSGDSENNHFRDIYESKGSGTYIGSQLGYWSQAYKTNIDTVQGGDANINTSKELASEGEIVTVNISKIESGKQFKSIQINDGTITTKEEVAGERYTFTMPAETVTVTIKLEESEFAGGTGTWDDPWIIKTARHLNNIRNYPGESWQRYYFKLANDINLNQSPWNEGEGWEPIGDWPDQFQGNFDGNNKTINGLTIFRPEEEYIGLFGRINSAIIKDLNLENINISGGSDVGSVVGHNSLGTIENIKVSGDIIGNYNNIGGLVGFNYNDPIGNSNSKVNNCHTNVNVIANTSNNVGGIVGGSNKGTVVNSSASGDITGNNYVGGLVGQNGYGSQINNSYSSGIVNGNSYVGGLAGTHQYSYGRYISDSYSTGIVNGVQNIGGLAGAIEYESHITRSYAAGLVTGNNYKGGLVGSITDSNQTSKIENSFWDKEATNQTSSAGSDSINGKTSLEMTQESLFTASDWDFDNIWAIDEGETYPYLRSNQQNPKPTPDL